MQTPPFDLQKAHRWFAMESNNLAWDLVAATEQSPHETQRMIDAAHAARFHWGEVGTLLNAMRADCLLATAYTKAKQVENAVRYAEACLALSDQAADMQTAFDRATVHGCAAEAYALAGLSSKADEQTTLCRAAAAALADADDREMVQKLYSCAQP